jgi:hypothetical protein
MKLEKINPEQTQDPNNFLSIDIYQDEDGLLTPPRGKDMSTLSEKVYFQPTDTVEAPIADMQDDKRWK